MSATLKVLFIAGAGRSGTTLLNQLLGQLPGFFAVGEMNYLWDAGYGRNQICSCGARLQACEFWGNVAKAVAGDVGPDVYAQFARLRGRVGYRSKLPQLFKVSLRSKRFRKSLAEYREVTERLLTEIRSRSGANVIVDSSKDPAHGLVLAGIPSVSLYVVHLVRNPYAVAFSRRNAKRKTSIQDAIEYMPTSNALVTALKWRTVNYIVSRVFGSGDRYVRLRYEDLASDPRGALVRLADFVGEDPGTMDFLSGRSANLAPTHTALGNPAKSTTGVVEIANDDRWRTEMGLLSRWSVRGCTAFSASRYGYRGNDHADC